LEEEEFSPRREPRLTRDWTKGSIIGNLLSLAWPMIIGSTITTLGPTFDMIWVGKLGAAAIAGVGISGMVVMLMNTVRMGLQTGTRALVARFVGAGDERGANHVGQQAFIISVAFSIFMAIIGIFFAEPMLLLLGLEADVVAEGAAYLRIQLVGMVTMSFQMMSQGIMQASGDAVTPMWIAVGARLFLGVSGAALANVITQGIAGGLGLWILFSGRTRLRLTMKNYRFDGNMIWRMVKIGIPAMIDGAGRTLATLVLTWFIVPFGTFAVASQSLMQRIDGFIQMPAMSLGQSAGVLAGQNLGAHQAKRAERTGWLAAGLFTSVILVASVVIWFLAENIVSIFDNEPGLVEIASTFLRITIVTYMVFGFVQVLMQCLNGAGDTIVPMMVTLLTMGGIMVPLAYILPHATSLGVYGVRWAMVSGNIVRAVIYVVYFKMGRWKRKQL
jgi:putative MATE family efflux protein